MWTVAFDANGGDGSMGAVFVIKDKSLTLPACEFTAPTGTSFGGWSENGHSDIYSVGTSYTPAQDTTLKAVWKANVTFNGNGGTGSMLEQVFIRGVDFTLHGNGYVRDGYTFLGWNTSTESPAKYANEWSVSFYENTTLYAIWEEQTPSTYTITYHANNGTPVTSSSGSILVDTAIQAPNGNNLFIHPPKLGFSKWTTNLDGSGSPYREGEALPQQNTDLYAQWAYFPVGGYNNGSLEYTSLASFAKNISDWYNSTYGESEGQVVTFEDDNGNGRVMTFNNANPIGVSNTLAFNGSTIDGDGLHGQISFNITGDGGIIRYTNYQGILVSFGQGLVTSNQIHILGNFVIDGDRANTTATGSALVIESGANVYIESGGSLTVKNNSKSSGDGGGIYIENGGSLEITDGGSLNVVENAASGDGGGIYVNSGSTLQINKNGVLQIDNNVASDDGGGIYVNSGDDVVLKNDGKIRITNNHAGDSGGGAYAYWNGGDFPSSSISYSGNTKGIYYHLSNFEYRRWD